MSATMSRHDFYGPIHKGLRLGSARMLIALGAADWRDAAASEALLAALRTHLILAREHLEHEDAQFHPPLAAVAPELAAALDADHTHHYETFARLDAAIAAMENAGDRMASGRALYLSFGAYFASDLQHMEREERVAMPAFQARYSDEELMAMEGRIIASISVEHVTAYYTLMLPGMSPTERATFLSYVKAVAPEAAFALLDGVARTALAPEDYRLLRADMALAA
ncbi:MAG: hypothetical protein JNJ73_12160 [Hyphomonadaceae bacterium]|nr:hypothetical protein [Hyphomonadaceae bacterium]